MLRKIRLFKCDLSIFVKKGPKSKEKWEKVRNAQPCLALEWVGSTLPLPIPRGRATISCPILLRGSILFLIFKLLIDFYFIFNLI